MSKDFDVGSKKIRRKGFAQVYDLHFNALSAYAYRYIKDIDVIEDLIQESFISFWENSNSVTDMPAIKAYLYTTVRNKCLNYLQHQAVVHKHEKNLIYELESDHKFENAVIEEETFNKLFLEISQLPAASREIMLLALNGLKNPEIAEELNISINTVKTQKKIAYAKLKKQLTPAAFSILISL